MGLRPAEYFENFKSVFSPSLASVDIAMPLPNARIGFPRTPPDPQLCVPVSRFACDSLTVPLFAANVSLSIWVARERILPDISRYAELANKYIPIQIHINESFTDETT
jgi:hypothetical protein